MGDTHSFHLKKKRWTEILSGDGPGMAIHSLTRIARARFLLNGGTTDPRNISDLAWIYDWNDSSWEEQQQYRLSEPLHSHRAVLAQTEEGLFVVCLGGFCAGHGKHYEKMLVYNIM